MIDKFVPDIPTALAGIKDGSTVLIAGFANGMPGALMQGLIGGSAS
jgi:acyl CoA:acetate/3-ketoacid CoA transferase alpha subunit